MRGRAEHDVALDRHAVGLLDGPQPGGYPRLTSGNGLAVASAVGTLGQGLTDCTTSRTWASRSSA